MALELCDYADEHPGPRVGCGAGSRGAKRVRGYGDFYGPVVNLAARVVKGARTGTWSLRKSELGGQALPPSVAAGRFAVGHTRAARLRRAGGAVERPRGRGS